MQKLERKLKSLEEIIRQKQENEVSLKNNIASLEMLLVQAEEELSQKKRDLEWIKGDKLTGNECMFRDGGFGVRYNAC